MSHIRAVLFDLDGTLHDRSASLQRFLVAQHQRLNLVAIIPLQTWCRRFTELDADGAVWKDRVYQALTTEFCLAVSWQELLADYEAHFPASAILYPDAPTVLATLRRLGLKLGLITNGRTLFQQAVIQAVGIDRYFDVTLISEAEGVQKPDPEIFSRALRRLNITAQQAIFVGDNPVADIEGAAKANMHAVWKRNDLSLSPSPYADAVINDLKEIYALSVFAGNACEN